MPQLIGLIILVVAIILIFSFVVRVLIPAVISIAGHVLGFAGG